MEATESPSPPACPVIGSKELGEWYEKFREVALALVASDDDGAAKRMTFTDVVKGAVRAGVSVEMIHQWGDEVGVRPQTVNRALREAGIRQRKERSDKGRPRGGSPLPEPEIPGPPPPPPIPPPPELDAKLWAETLLKNMSNDRVAACDFVNEMVAAIAAAPE